MKKTVVGVAILLFVILTISYSRAFLARNTIPTLSSSPAPGITQLPDLDSLTESSIERQEVSGKPLSPDELVVDSCRLFGEVMDSRGNFLSVPFINVFKIGDSMAVKVPVQDGLFEHFVDEGIYALLVPNDSLPNDVLPQLPLQKFQKRGFSDESGMYPPLISVAQGDKEIKAQVVLLRPCRVEGRVINGAGEVVENASVRLQSFIPGAQSLSIDCSTDSDGRFLFLNVRPGAKYVLEVWLDYATIEKNRSLSLPIPTPIQTESGQIHVLPDVIVGSGEIDLQGQVFNQDGQPYPNLKIICYYGGKHRATERPFGMSATLSWVYTDSDGRFLMKNLPASILKVQLCGDWEPGIPLGRRNTAFWLPAIDIDATDKRGVIDVGSHIVDRSKPFMLTISLIDKGTQGLANPCTVNMDFLDPQNGWSSKEAGRPSFSPMEWSISPGASSIEWGCETPLPPVLFRVIRDGEEVGRLEVFPAPDTTDKISIALDP